MKETFYASKVKMAQETDRIKETAKRIGLVLPSTHTALFQAIYSPINSPNKNGVRLAKDAVDKALPGLIGSQSNFEHLGQGFMLGVILDAFVNDNEEIEIVFSFAKNLYGDEYTRALELMQSGDLHVSFELMADTNAQEELTDGTILLHDIDFQGVGLLLDNDPAYPKADVYKFAKSVRDRVTKIDDKELICASQVKEQCEKILSKEDKKNTKMEENKLKEADKKKIEEIRAELGDFAKDVKDEDLLNDEKVEELRKEMALQDTPEVDRAIKTIADNLGISTEMVRETLRQLEDASLASLEESKATIEKLEEEIETLKATLEAKDSETEEVREKAEQIGKKKVELKDNPFVKDFKDEDYLNEEKVAEAVQKQKNAETIETRKEELKDNEFAKDFSDEDFLNEDKVELAKVKKEKADLEAKSEEKESKEDSKSEKVEAKEEKEEMEAGSEDESTYEKVMADIREQKSKNTSTYKVFKRK